MRRGCVVSATLMICIGLVGCGGSGDDGGFANRIQPDIAPDGAKTLRLGNGSEPETLDPQKASGVPSANILIDLYEGLVITGKHARIVPGVAKSWDISKDRLTCAPTPSGPMANR